MYYGHCHPVAGAFDPCYPGHGYPVAGVHAGHGFGGFALIVVLFILLIIIGASCCGDW
ncbi:YjcZ family sporulation protein [Bacillus sp. DTU_2020_1000418_1_SI_GHA_SEK_038]|uniref:YjcZ family sporulation protein n=1 Tax=Bacillus sp. DTU_2020_1000418_1_SI_GHA_SEK_038 TaxID=3077585 RepID=UPI0028E9E804|nr:YjcZ family sporulation protein [Bacillus sp. DTU_2020_1000418_1_SI_GHA_SEK_038]WNS73898.1 YjcZ family sporulation protein [Bacillus sp. DTU_2020_1000418_1_SI_GHA_SEK_038]